MEADWRGLADYLVKFQTEGALQFTVRELDILRTLEELLTLNSPIQRKFPFSVPGIFVLLRDIKRNSACVAGNVGDNVGDIAGMGADLCGSFAEATCVALVLVASSNDLQSSWKTLVCLVLISSLGIVVGIVMLTLRNVIYRVHDEFGAVEKAPKGYSHRQHGRY